MLKVALAVAAIGVAGTTAYVVRSSQQAPAAATTSTAASTASTAAARSPGIGTPAVRSTSPGLPPRAAAMPHHDSSLDHLFVFGFRRGAGNLGDELPLICLAQRRCWATVAVGGLGRANLASQLHQGLVECSAALHG